MKKIILALLFIFPLQVFASGVSSVSNYNPTAVTITGGTINATTIGQTTPAAVKGTTGVFTGAVSATTGTFSGANVYVPGATGSLFLGNKNGTAAYIGRNQDTSGSSTPLYFGEAADTGITYFRGSGGLNVSGNSTFGTTAAKSITTLNGPNSGANNGTILYLKLAAASLIQMGNYSAVYGTADDDRPTMYTAKPWVFTRGITSFSPIDGIGYSTGAGGSVTQVTSITTGVTLNNITGKITTVSVAFGAGAINTFFLTNSTIASTDTVSLSGVSGGTNIILYSSTVSTGGGGTFITMYSPAGTGTATFTINFNVIKGSIN